MFHKPFYTDYQLSTDILAKLTHNRMSSVYYTQIILHNFTHMGKKAIESHNFSFCVCVCVKLTI